MHRPRLLVALVFAALLLAAPAAPASSSGVVVSQVYAGGGNSGASFTNDFVELFNAGPSSIILDGWTVQYASAAGTSWQATALAGSIAPGHHYLVQLNSAASVGAPLPTPDATGTSNLAVSGGKVAVVTNASAISCGATAGSCSGVSGIEDLVGYGSAADYEGASAAAAPSSSTAAIRADAGCTDTDSNTDDFDVDTPTPRNSSSPVTSCTDGGGSPGGTTGSASVDVDIQNSLSLALEQPAISFGTASSGTTPAPVSERVTVNSNNASRLFADRPSHGFHAGRPPARHREHGSGRRDARPRARRRSACSRPDPAGGRPARRHDVGPQRSRRRCLAHDARVHRPAARGRPGPLLGDRHLHAHRSVRPATASAAVARPGRPRPRGGGLAFSCRADRFAVTRRPERVWPRSGDGDELRGRPSRCRRGPRGIRARSPRTAAGRVPALVLVGRRPEPADAGARSGGDADRVGACPAACPARRPLGARAPDLAAARPPRRPGATPPRGRGRRPGAGEDRPARLGDQPPRAPRGKGTGPGSAARQPRNRHRERGRLLHAALAPSKRPDPGATAGGRAQDPAAHARPRRVRLPRPVAGASPGDLSAPDAWLPPHPLSPVSAQAVTCQPFLSSTRARGRRLPRGRSSWFLLALWRPRRRERLRRPRGRRRDRRPRRRRHPCVQPQHRPRREREYRPRQRRPGRVLPRHLLTQGGIPHRRPSGGRLTAGVESHTVGRASGASGGTTPALLMPDWAREALGRRCGRPHIHN